MNCAISGVVPIDPVVSLKSGYVFERALIEKHLKESHVCPVTKEELSVTDLLPLKGNKIITPRAASATTIPGVLQLLQNEWDALMLETYNLKESLHQTRQELAHALYQHDAACRVIARLIKERDEAKGALGDTQANVANAIKKTGPASMEIEEGTAEGGINAGILKVLQDVAKKLSKNRKQFTKDLQAKVAGREQISNFEVSATHPLHSPSKPGILCLDLHPSQQDLVLTGGADSTAILFNHSNGKIVDTLKGHKKKLSDVKFHPTENVLFTASHDHTAIIWHTKEEGKYSVGHTLKGHKGPVVGVTVHPSGSYVVTASTDKSWAFYDVASGVLRASIVDDEKITAGFTRVTFHPDGLILGTGTADSVVRIFDVKQQKNVAVFKGHTGAVTAVTFSENGYYLASGDEQGIVKLWDLRKLQNFHTISQPEMKNIADMDFDLSGSYLAVAGDDLRVFGTKEWDLVKNWNDHTEQITGVKFGNNAGFLATTSKDRSLKIWKSSS